VRRRQRWWARPTWRDALVVLCYALASVVMLYAIAAGLAGQILVSVLLWAVFAGGLVAYTWYLRRVATARRRRLDLLAAWAVRHGWTLRQVDPRLKYRWHGPPFDLGGTRGVSEARHGQVEGRPVVSFVHVGQPSDARAGEVSHVVAVDLPAALPDLGLLLETTASGVADAVGVRDLQVESAAFNRARLIVCDDPRYAHAVLHPRAIELLLTGPLQDRPVRIEGSAVLTWSPGPTDVDQVIPLVEALSAFAGTIPRHVLADHGRRPGPEQDTAAWVRS
jgi:hypothetical protein